MLRAYHNYEQVVKKEATLEVASELGELARKLARKIFLSVKTRIFCTRDGLIGLGPQHISENDSVCILHGSKIPCILREKNRIMVGKSYDNAFMKNGCIESLLIEKKKRGMSLILSNQYSIFDIR